MKIQTVCLIALVAFAIGLALGFSLHKAYYPCVELPVVNIQRDTVVRVDTIKGKPQPPVKSVIIRVDTVRMQIKPQDGTKPTADTTRSNGVPDTLKTPRLGQDGNVLIPIEQKVYKSEDYTAYVSGWRPSLDSIEVYKKHTTVTNTVTKYKPPRWALTAGGGVGYTPDKKIVPYVGLGVGLVLWSK